MVKQRMRNLMKIDSKNKWYMILCILLLIAAVAEFIWLGFNKEIWFIDEILSYETTNGFEQEWPDEVRNVWQTRSDIVSFMAADKPGLHFRDMNVYMTKYADQLPFYYYIFRIASLVAYGSASPWIGLLINLPLYICFLFVVYSILLKITGGNWVAVVSTFFVCIYCNRLILEQATMIRLYMMLLLLETLLIFCGIALLEEAKTEKYPIKKLIAIFVVSVCGLLTTYDFWAFYAVTASTFCIYLLVGGIIESKESEKSPFIGRHFKLAYGWIVSFGMALFVTVIVFRYCIKNLFKDQGARALSSFFHITKDRLKYVGRGYESVVWDYSGGLISTGLGISIIAIILLCGLIIMFRENDKREAIYVSLALFSSQAYQIIITYSMPDGYEERYFWGSTTILMFIVAICFIKIVNQCLLHVSGNSIRMALNVVVALLVAIFLCGKEIMIIANGDGIAYLNDSGKNIAFLQDNEKAPWIVYGDIGGGYGYFDWTIPENICFVSDDGSESAIEALKELSGTDNFVLYCHSYKLEEAQNLFSNALGREVVCEEVTRGGWLKVYDVSVMN